MESFQNDPVHYFRYLLGMEYAANGLEMAQDILQLLDNRKPIKEQLVALEQVWGWTDGSIEAWAKLGFI